jgi:hypothetical protein
MAVLETQADAAPGEMVEIPVMFKPVVEQRDVCAFTSRVTAITTGP